MNAVATVPNHQISLPLAPSGVINLSNPTFDDVRQAVESLMKLMDNPQYGRQKITVNFKEPTKVRVNRRQSKTLDEMKVKFFISTSGVLAYTFNKRTGFSVQFDLDYSKICRLSIEPAYAVKREKVERVLALGRRIHPNAWDDLRQKIEANPESYLQYGLNEMSMVRIFGENVVKQIEHAFETKTDFTYEKPGRTQRDRRVQVKMCSDGILRAWYSSEYIGCGNGGYYLLINPRVATFCEMD